MQLNLPWILSRKRLIIAAIADGILFAILYYLLYEWRFGAWPILSPRLLALLAFWALSSYVIGRYSSGASRDQLITVLQLILRQIKGTLLTLAIIVLLVFCYYLIFIDSLAGKEPISSLVICLATIGLISSFFQLIFQLIVNSRHRGGVSRWLYGGSSHGYDQLKLMLKY